MSFLKKQSAGFFVTLLAIILAFVSVIFYLINCNTAYFATYGTDHSIVAMIIIAIVIEIAYITGSELVYSNLILDILPCASSIVLVLAFISFVQSRVNSIASIMTFQNNAQTMADLSSAIIGMVFCFLAIVVCVISSFFRMVKE